MPALFRTRRFAGLALAGLAIAGAALWWLARSEDSDAAERVARGELLYQQHCAACHGANLEGQPNWQLRRPDGRLPAPPHDATGHTWHHGDAQLFEITKRGLSAIVPNYASDMPAFGGTLSDSQIRDILGFIKSRWPSDIAARQQQITDAYQRQRERP